MSPLRDKLLKLIALQGPITLGQYMQFALSDPEYGYYKRGNPLGRSGDFITAPEVSQLFGEMIGLFLVQAWRDLERPQRFHLTELGPGRGTLMADVLRVAEKTDPALVAAAQITLVETSPALRRVQEATLRGAKVCWAEHFDAVARDAPLFLIANEFFDALPVRQFVKSEAGWHERMVAARDGTLAWALTPEPVPVPFIPPHLREAEPGAVFELNSQAAALAAAVGGFIAAQGGAALFIDYGHGETELGDTFQAVARHRYADVLAEPGAADLTAHVDFARLGQAAAAEGARVSGPVPQGAFLKALGIELRARRLAAAAPAEAADIAAALARLTAPDQMGEVFKVMGLARPGAPPLPGF